MFSPALRPGFRFPTLGLAGLAIVSFALFGSFYTIDSKFRGVLLRNGKVVTAAEPGLHFKVPFIDSIQKISVQNEVKVFEKLSAYSKDQQPADMRVSVSYHVPPNEVITVYNSYGTLAVLEERLMSRQVPTQLENVFGQYTAVSAVQNRPKLVADFGKALKENVRGPVLIDSVQIENIDFSPAYETAISDRMTAEVAVTTRKQDLEKERINAEITVTKAKAEADSNLAKARATAEGIKLKGEAEADAIRAKAAALAQNQNLVELIRAERWDGKLPTQMIPGASVPFINAR